MTDIDPVEAHVATLARGLRGPAAARRSMLAETRDGLCDAVAAHRASGLGPAEAAARAVAEFGSVEEIAPLYQDELVARQGRRAALLLTVAFPALLVGWNLLWSNGVGWNGDAPVLVRVMAGVQDVASVVVAATALTLLAATFLRTASARLVAAAVGVTGAAGAAVCVGTAVVTNLAGGPTTVTFVTTDPYAPLAYTASGLVLGAVLFSVVRTLRLVRHRPARESTQLRA